MRGLSSTDKQFSWLGHILQDVQLSLSDFRCFLVSNVCREANFVAHALVRYARHVSDDIVWLEDSPPLAEETLYFDLTHLH